jgi:hypothetical protein
MDESSKGRSGSTGSATESPNSAIAVSEPTEAFIDDLATAIRLKNYLIGRGFDVPKETIVILADLECRYMVYLSKV